MAITSARYGETGDINVTSGSLQIAVPDDMSNRHRRLLAAWEAAGNTIEPYVQPVIDLDALATATLNAALAQPGSVVRALALLTLQEVNKLRVKGGETAYTLAQFTAALKAKMRNGA